MNRRPGKAPDLADMLAGDAASDSGADTASWVVFERCGRVFAVDARSVDALVKTPPVTPIPYPPPSVAGIAPVRGRVRIVFCPAGEPSTPSARLILLEGDGQLALAADRVSGVVPDAGSAEMIDPEALLAG